MKNEYVWREELNISGSSLVDTVKQLVHEGDIRRIIIKNEDGEVLMEIPFLIGTVVALAAPILAAMGAIGAILGYLTVVIERVAAEENIAREESRPKSATREDILESILIEQAAGPDITGSTTTGSTTTGSATTGSIKTERKRNEQLEIISEEEALAELFNARYSASLGFGG